MSSRLPSSRAPHYLEPERRRAALGFQALTHPAELAHHGLDRLAALAPEQKARMHDHGLGMAGDRDSGRVVEHPHRHLVLSTSLLDVPEKCGERRVDRECDVGLACQFAKAVRKVPVHPEAASEFDFARVVPLRDEPLNGFVRGVTRGQGGRSDSKQTVHSGVRSSVRRGAARMLLSAVVI